ncbi:MAG: hypothetical protein RMJ37_01860 [Spirochaetia bacterium]|nr:hypothetical protein [Spirochaetota bacterium]MCX8096622.1 hypothetical protein [Spirochaetota bacterium]MDW8112069.1 hypothetical protein [Spirochaetia bacterium]
MKKVILVALSLVVGLSIIYGFTLAFSHSHEDDDHKHHEEAQEGLPVEEESWGALDEIVIEKYAEERGKKPGPAIPLSGDLILLSFSLFSAIAGFLIGYFSRDIFKK